VPQSIIKHRKASFDKLEKTLYAQNSKSGFKYVADVNNLGLSNTDFYDISYTKKQQGQIDELIDAIQTKTAVEILSLTTDLSVYHPAYGARNIIFPIAFKYHRGVLHLCTFNKTTSQVSIIPLEFARHFPPKKMVM